MLKLIEVKGDYYECGYQVGIAMKKQIIHRMKRLVPELAFKKKQKELLALHKLGMKLYPNFIRELEGMADGAKLDYWRLLFLNAPELKERPSGCTSIAQVNGKDVSLFHNEDGVGKERAQDCFLVHYVLPKMSFHAFVYAGELPGGAYTWTSYGVYFSVNYLMPIRPDIAGRVSRNFVARQLVEAKNVKDGIKKLKAGRDASGYHYFLGKGKEIVSVEQFRDAVSVRPVKGFDFHSNHYIHPSFAKKAPSYKNSRVRLEQTAKLLAKQRKPLEVLSDRTHGPYAICAKPFGVLFTISTVRFFPLEHRVEVYEPGSLKLTYRFELV